MKLEINKKHTKANVSNLNFLKNRVFIPFFSAVISLSFLSGCDNDRDINKAELPEDTKDGQHDFRNNTNETQEIVIDGETYETTYEEVTEPIDDVQKMTEPTEIVQETVSIVDENGVVNIPDCYRYNVASLCGKSSKEDITLDDLSKLTFFYITYDDNSDLSWLKYCTNLKSFMVYINNDNLNALSSIKYLPNLESLSLYSLSSDNLADFSNEKFGFIRDMKSLKNLTIYNLNVEPGLIEACTNIKNLKLKFNYECDIDYSKLIFLDSLEFDTLPYSVVVSFDLNDYNTLKNNGVEIAFSEDGNLDKFYSANKKLDEIVKSFNLDKKASDKDKLNAILIYVLDNLTYDEEVSEIVRSGLDYTDIAGTFYTDGVLHGFIEKDTAICGNYAALVDALANRLNLGSFVATSDNHAWNIISVDGDNYYVDATWLDGTVICETVNEYDESGRLICTRFVPSDKKAQDLIEIGYTDELNWYMEDPTEIDDLDSQESHEINNLPDYIIIEPIEDEEVIVEESTPTETIPIETIPTETIPIETIPTETIPTESVYEDDIDDTISNNENEVKDITNKKFKITIGKKSWIIAGGALIGILSGLGIAVGVRKKKKKEEERRRRQRQMDQFYGFDYYSDYSSDYTDTSSNGRRRF